jgi:hypothetical protein
MVLLIAIIAAAILAGCGSGVAGGGRTKRPAAAPSAASGPTTPTTPGPGPSIQTIPTPGPTGVPADPAAVAVIRAWSSALRRGDIRGAARYFALPSVMVNGPDSNGNAVAISIRTVAQAQAANASLPCGARFISADQRGRYVNALFRLTDRPGPGGGCGGGTGDTARTNFVISDGRIAEWIRAPNDPGDNGNPPAPGPQSTPQTSSPAV